MKAIFVFVRRAWRADALSPEGLVVRASILIALYAISRIAGLQEYTTFLSGTSPNISLSWQMGLTLGLLHLLLYFASILLVPILLMTAALLTAWNRWKSAPDDPADRNGGAPIE